MSLEQGQAFRKRMISDDSFNATITRIEDVETKIAYINREGYNFTADELEMATYQLACFS